MYSPLEQFDVVLVTPLIINLGGGRVFEISIFHGILVIALIVVFIYLLSY